MHLTAYAINGRFIDAEDESSDELDIPSNESSPSKGGGYHDPFM